MIRKNVLGENMGTKIVNILKEKVSLESNFCCDYSLGNFYILGNTKLL